MATGIFSKNRAVKIGLLFGLWTLIGLSFASQFYLSSSLFGRSVTWGQAINYALADWYVWAVLSIGIFYLARRFPLERDLWQRHALIHVVASAAVSLLYMVIRAWVGLWQNSLAGEAVTFGEVFKPLLVKTFHFNLLIYWVIVSISHAFDYYRKFHERELNTLELEKRLAEARLQALLVQLNPHFLFNTLHGISSLMHQDVEAADKMLARLSDLLRRTLENTSTQVVPLSEELSLLERYLDIERIRFGERLSVKIDAPADTLGAEVPNLILQPLVENAIRHGIEPHARTGRIELRVRRNNGQLQLEVRDNGDGFKGEVRHEEGVGLSNTRARLRELYGAEQQFTLRNGEAGGFVAEIIMPWKAFRLSPIPNDLNHENPHTHSG